MCGRSIAGRLRALWCGRPSEAERDVEAGGGTIAEGLRQAVAPLPRVEGESGVRYDLLQVVGKGGFGKVYKAAVVDEGALPPLVAIKAERAESLEMEVRVLGAVAPSAHFCALLERGLDPQSGCPFVVMSLLGPNLSVVRKAMPGQRLSLSTAVRAGIQMLHAIEELHGRGFVSRDVKPSNFAVGLPHEHRRLIYMLDFGIAHEYADESGDPRPPTRSTWRGTTRYCALANHRRQTPAPKDDVESWLYSLVELAVGRLPWAALDKQAKDATFRAKLDVRRDHRRAFFAPLPHQFDHMLARIDAYDYYSRPDYGQFFVDLMHVMDAHSFSFADEYDWERVFEGYSASTGAE